MGLQLPPEKVELPYSNSTKVFFFYRAIIFICVCVFIEGGLSVSNFI